MKNKIDLIPYLPKELVMEEPARKMVLDLPTCVEILVTLLIGFGFFFFLVNVLAVL